MLFDVLLSAFKAGWQYIVKLDIEKLIIKNKESDMSLIEKWTEKHSELLRFYSTENLTERERNLLRTQMKDYLELIEDFKANEPKKSTERERLIAFSEWMDTDDNPLFFEDNDEQVDYYLKQLG